MTVNILLLNWNSSGDISQGINSIIKSIFSEYRIILIDNNSEKYDQEKLINDYNFYKQQNIDIHFVLNDENYGYAGGNNRGYEYLKAQGLDGDILILNPDIEIAENTLYEMWKTLNTNENVGAVMTRTLTSDGTILYDYIKLNGFRQKWQATNHELIETDYVAGSCMLLRREIIDKVGLFDEKYFMYWEEVDLSFRIKRIGYELCSTTKTFIIRKDNSTERSINSIYFYIRNTFYLKKDFNLSSWRHIFFLTMSLLSQLKSGILTGSLNLHLGKYIAGIVDGYKYSRANEGN